MPVRNIYAFCFLQSFRCYKKEKKPHEHILTPSHNFFLMTMNEKVISAFLSNGMEPRMELLQINSVREENLFFFGKIDSRPKSTTLKTDH